MRANDWRETHAIGAGRLVDDRVDRLVDEHAQRGADLRSQHAAEGPDAEDIIALLSDDHPPCDEAKAATEQRAVPLRILDSDRLDRCAGQRALAVREDPAPPANLDPLVIEAHDLAS